MKKQDAPPLVMDPTIVRQASSIRVDLIAGRSDDLKRQIDSAGVAADGLRRQIQAAAERRHAKSPAGRDCTVRLYAWPMLVSFDTSKPISTKQEPEFYAPRQASHAPLAAKIRALWTNTFVGSGAAEVLPLPRAVHLNAVMGGDPFKVHRCVFNGASILEGRRPEEFYFTFPNNANREEVGGPVAAPYLLLAYAATPAGAPDPTPRLSAQDKMVAQQIFAAMMGVNGGEASVQLFNPQGFFGALDTLHMEQLWHFVQWAEKRGLAPRVELREELEPTGLKTLVCVRVADADERGGGSEHAWAFDSTWRPLDGLQSMVDAINLRRRRMRSSASDSAMKLLNNIFKTVH